jgi:hypothetical protein
MEPHLVGSIAFAIPLTVPEILLSCFVKSLTTTAYSNVLGK